MRGVRGDGPTPEGSAADASALVPTASATAGTPERYAGAPMLAIIDSYALSVVGALSEDKEAFIRQVVKRTFGGDDVFHMPDGGGAGSA